MLVFVLSVLGTGAAFAASGSGDAAASEEPAVTQARMPAEIGTPEPEQQSCSAELDCGDGNVISCTGSSGCVVNEPEGYVECEGDRTTCPNRCEVYVGCCNEPNPCGVHCYSNAGNCQTGAYSVTCDGGTVECSTYCWPAFC
jgi:hypothetical protein